MPGTAQEFYDNTLSLPVFDADFNLCHIILNDNHEPAANGFDSGGPPEDQECWLDAQQQNVELAMISQVWFETIPPSGGGTEGV